MRRQPSVSDLSDLMQALGTEPCDVNRNVLAQRLETQFESMKLEALAFEIHRLAREQRSNDMYCLSQSRERLLVSNSVKVLDDSSAARAKSQSKSSSRYFIERPRAHSDKRRAARED